MFLICAFSSVLKFGKSKLFPCVYESLGRFNSQAVPFPPWCGQRVRLVHTPVPSCQRTCSTGFCGDTGSSLTPSPTEFFFPTVLEKTAKSPCVGQVPAPSSNPEPEQVTEWLDVDTPH